MPIRPTLNQRYQTILRATVRHYIVTAEPVGSKTLAEEYALSVSSATIRNAMGQLEKAGLLYQPHTSAGRIPSDSGYRIYVDELITSDETSKKKIEKSFKSQLDWERGNLENILQNAAHILASVSGYIALITMPQTNSTQIKHLQLVSMGGGQILLILVTDIYQTQSILINAHELAENVKK
jgi:heat-inducible transcriptional repressor